MATFHAQHVFRHDRKHAGEGERPERGRAQKNSDADAADVRTREVEPLADEDPTEDELGDESRDNGEGSPFVAFEDAVEEMADHQNERDEERRDVAVVETELAPGSKSRRSYGLNSRVAHTWSTDYTDSLIL